MSGRPALTIERTFEAPAERVFDAFTSEEVIRRWWHAAPDWETPEARVDLRIGGEVRVQMHDPNRDETYGGGGVYTTVERPSRLAFTWIWDNDDDRVEQLIVINFQAEGAVTRVRFTHENLWNEEAVRSHEEGWNLCFDNLEAALREG